MKNVVEQIGDLAIKFVALARFAEHKTEKTPALVTDMLIINRDIEELCLMLDDGSIQYMHDYVRQVSAWIPTGPIARA